MKHYNLIIGIRLCSIISYSEYLDKVKTLLAGRKIMTSKIHFLFIVVIFIAIFNECNYF